MFGTEVSQAHPAAPCGVAASLVYVAVELSIDPFGRMRVIRIN